MSAHSNVNISMPGSLKAFVDKRLKSAGFGNVSEYFRHLIREDQKRAADDELEALLLEGLNSGPGVEVTPEWWARHRAELDAKARRRARK